MLDSMRMNDKKKLHEIVFVTSNKGKLSEAQSILNVTVKSANVHLDEIQSLDLEEIVRHKIKQATTAVNKPLIVDDTGIFIEEWNGFPGPFVKFIYEEGGCELMLKMLEGVENRRTYALCVIGFYDGTNTHIFKGRADGTITKEMRGKTGWGFDFILIPEGLTQTFAEMGEEQKNKISHRKKALEQLQTFIHGNYSSE